MFYKTRPDATKVNTRQSYNGYGLKEKSSATENCFKNVNDFSKTTVPFFDLSIEFMSKHLKGCVSTEY